MVMISEPILTPSVNKTIYSKKNNFAAAKVYKKNETNHSFYLLIRIIFDIN